MPDSKHEPTFEEYNLDSSIYKNYREQLSSLNIQLDETKKTARALRSSFITVSGEVLLFAASFFLIFLVLRLFLSIGGAVAGAFWLSVILTSALNEVVTNIFNGGKLRKLKVTEEDLKLNIETLRKETRDKVKPFEKAATDYFSQELQEYYHQYLFKKRAGNERFDSVLSEFSSMLEDISKMNSTFLTASVPVGEYKNYVLKRSIDQTYQVSKRESGGTKTHNFTSRLSHESIPVTKVIHAPHKLYRTARKIDNWEEIHKRNAVTGLKGEEIAVVIEKEFFKSIGRNDLAEKVRHVAVELGDGLGYDVLSFFEDGREKYIEVKSTTSALSTLFYLSRNELGFLQEHTHDSFVYRIQVTDETPHIEVHSSTEILENDEIIPVQYLVRSR